MALVNYEVDGFVATITINRPEQLNALNSDLLRELDAVLGGIDQNAVRCVIVTGAGEKSFVAGADIAQMSTLTKQEAKAFGVLGNRVFRKLETLPMPTIAAVNGFALGGGCELALSCDIRIACEKASFAQPEVGLGITPGFGGTQRLSRLVGSSMAKQLIFSAQRIKAPEALRIGLVSAVYPAEELMGEVKKLADAIAANAPIAVRASKKAIDEGLETPLEQAVLELEPEYFASCFETSDQKNAMLAFVEKRPAEPFVNQ